MEGLKGGHGCLKGGIRWLWRAVSTCMAVESCGASHDRQVDAHAEYHREEHHMIDKLMHMQSTTGRGIT